MNAPWERLHRLWESGTPCGLATVVSTFGSAPRRPGSIMICAPDGTVTGSVSGGCVEGAVYELAHQAVRDGTAVLERYGVSDDDAGAVGLTCGGTIEVLVERVDRRSFPELGVLLRHLRSATPVALATVVGSDPSRPGARRGAHLVCWADGTAGSTGCPALDGETAAAARRLLAQGRSGTVRPAPVPPAPAGANGMAGPDGAAGASGASGADAAALDGGPRVFVNCLAPPPRMLVYGANEFAAALVHQGALLGFRVTLCDARPVFTTPERFPDADDVVVAWPHRHLAEQAAAGRLDERSVVVSLTHDPKFELPLLAAALRLDLAYVGAMGSRRSVADRRAALRAAGLTDGQLAGLSAPVGLDLGGADPAETALAVAAEILLLRRGGRGVRLSETSGPIHAGDRGRAGPDAPEPDHPVLTAAGSPAGFSRVAR
ncbi:XdhC family protein [Streptomyces synnematoformans]|uniref:XdhC family protein n=1 Tax=Streptomyces synnematoformans TaxID=415721 RepID=A0ABP5KF72_9ACTN